MDDKGSWDSFLQNRVLISLTYSIWNSVYIESHTPSPFSMLFRKIASSRDMKRNIAWGGRGRIVELRGEIGLKYSKMEKCLNTFVTHCLKVKNCYLIETIHCMTWIRTQDILISHVIILVLFSITWN